MKITERMTNLETGTTIIRSSGCIILTSGYDSFHDHYEYRDADVSDDGDMVELATGGYVSPSDLIGGEI